MDKGSDLCPILFVWDGVWDCDASHRWRFNGKQSKIVYIKRDVTFMQLLDKVYSVTKMSSDEYEVDLSSWFGYQQVDPMPPCPLSDDDDVRVLIHVNSEKTLSVPLCLTTKKRSKIVVTQPRREGEMFESASSNHEPFHIDTEGTIVPETQPPVIPSIDKKGKAIDLNQFPRQHVDDYDQGLENIDGFGFGLANDINVNALESPAAQKGTHDADSDDDTDNDADADGDADGDDDDDSFFYNDHDGMASGSAVGEQATLDDTYEDRLSDDPFFWDDIDGTAWPWISPLSADVNETPRDNNLPMHDDPFEARDALPRAEMTFVPPQQFNEAGDDVGKSDGKKTSIGTGQSGVGQQSTNVGTSCNSIPVENDFEVHQVCLSKDDLNRRLCMISMLKNRQFKVKKSDSLRFIAICVDSNCNWRLRASKMKESNFWVVKRYHNIHTCSLDMTNNDHRQARSKVLGDIIKYHYTNPTHVYPPRAVIAEVKNRFSVNISYNTAWRAKKEALKLVRGSPDDAFKLLPSYFARLNQVNGGTVTHFETDVEGHFKYCFMAVGVSIRGFLSCIRPVLAIDGTHLKGKYRGTLLIATGMDGNNQLYPLAFGVVDSENNASWEWFLQKIHDIIGDLPDLVFISDRHKSIEKGVKEVFPNAYHGICMEHLKRNVASRFKGVDVKSLITCAAKTYIVADFNTIMNEISRISRDVYNYLIDAGVERWARVHFPGRRYSMLTTNIAESMNAVLRDVRQYPTVALLDAILMKLLQWYHDRREVAAKMKTVLTTWAEKIVRRRDEMSRRFDARPIDHYTYLVLDGDRNAQVDLNQKTCTCNIFQLDQLPCAHAFAAASKVRMSRYGLASKFFTSDALVAAYAEPVFPVGHADLWNTPAEVLQMDVLAPIMRVPPGRPRRNRILSQGEVPVRRKCAKCEHVGHNRKTCRNPVQL